MCTAGGTKHLSTGYYVRFLLTAIYYLFVVIFRSLGRSVLGAKRTLDGSYSGLFWPGLGGVSLAKREEYHGLVGNVARLKVARREDISDNPTHL